MSGGPVIRIASGERGIKQDSGDELCQLPQILGGRCKQESLNGASRRALANPWNRTLLVGVRRNQGGVHRETLAANQTFLDATADDTFKNMPKGVAFSEAAMAVLRKCGMVRNFTFQAEATKPAIGEIEMHFLAQSPF